MADILFRYNAPRQGFEFGVPYDDTFRNAFKQAVPPSKRSWDPNTKRWFVHSDFLDEATELADMIFGGHQIIYTADWMPPKDEQRQRQHTPATEKVKVDNTYGILFITSDAPWEVVKAAYRALALMYHPDTGTGDEEKMKLLNLAFDQIKYLRQRGG